MERSSIAKAAEIRAEMEVRKAFLNLRGKRYLKMHDAFAKLWADRFKEQAAEFVAQVENNPQMFIARKAADDAFEKENEKRILEVYELGMEIQDAECVKQAQVELFMGIDLEGAKKYAANRAGTLIKDVDATTRKEVSAIISRAMDGGLSMKETAEEITKTFAGYSKYRAGLIAVMETGNAYELGKREQFDAYTSRLNTVGWKRSRVADGTARPTHVQNAEDGWIPKNQLFSGTKTDHAPHGFNCRCSVSYSIYEPESD